MKPAEKGDTKISDVLIKVFVPAIVAGVIGWVILGIFSEVIIPMHLSSHVSL